MDEFTDVVQKYYERQIIKEANDEDVSNNQDHNGVGYDQVCGSPNEGGKATSDENEFSLNDIKKNNSLQQKSANKSSGKKMSGSKWKDAEHGTSSDNSNKQHARTNTKQAFPRPKRLKGVYLNIFSLARRPLNFKGKVARVLLQPHPELFPVIFLSSLIHIILIIYSCIHDKYFNFRYTDIDYFVMSDAADFSRSGGSPYERSTYRYSPIFAYLLYPNAFTKGLWGKLLFSSFGIFAGVIMYDILKTIRGLEIKKALRYTTWFWFLNPYIIAVNTRGSSDSLVAAMICYILIDMIKEGPGKKNAALFALAVIVRMYTIIYSPIFWLAISPSINEVDMSIYAGASSICRLFIRSLNLVHPFITLRRAKWAITSGLSFLLICTFFYYKYSDDFLVHTFFYHFTRIDVKNNFSPMFYYHYLTFNSQKRLITKILFVLPQPLITLIIPFSIKDTILAAFCQTLFFVSSNRVSTAQYFMWYMTFLPIIIGDLKLNKLKILYGSSLIIAWCVLQFTWNSLAYKLEYLGDPSALRQLWIICLLFYLVNIFILVFILRNDEYNDSYVHSNTPETKRPYPVLKHSEDEKSAIDEMTIFKLMKFKDLVYTHRKGLAGVELHTISKTNPYKVVKLITSFTFLPLAILIILPLFLVFKNMSSAFYRVICSLLVFHAFIFFIAISTEPLEASLLRVPGAGLIVKHSSAISKAENFLTSANVKSVLLVERFYKFKVIFSLIAIVKTEINFHVNEDNDTYCSKFEDDEKIHKEVNNQDVMSGHSPNCKLFRSDLKPVPLIPVPLSCTKFMVDILQSLNVSDE